MVVSCVLGIAWHLYLEMRYNGDAIPTGYPSWARKWTCSGFPVFGAKGYFNSTNASLAIGVRRSFGTLHDPQALRFKHQVRGNYRRSNLYLEEAGSEQWVKRVWDRGRFSVHIPVVPCINVFDCVRVRCIHNQTHSMLSIASYFVVFIFHFRVIGGRTTLSRGVIESSL